MSLILRIRSEVLKRNLEEIRKKIDQPPLGKRFTELSTASERSKELLLEIQEKLSQLKIASQKKGSTPDLMYGELRAIEGRAEDLYTHIRKVCDEASNLSAASLFNFRDKGRPAVGLECAEELGKILTHLDLETPDLTEAWQLYARQYAVAQNLLSQYLEVIGGLAVRDAGFDNGMCDYADELITLVAGSTSSSMAIPARQETIRMTWGRIVRMGCPEWTIWALPLTAHDVWYTAAQETLETSGKADEFSDPARWVQECLADAFAMWSTGPAYAYAAFCLRLDPFSVNEDSEGCMHDLRAYAILKMWELMDLVESQNLSYRSLREQLVKEWLAALRFAQPDRPATGMPVDAAQGDRPTNVMPVDSDKKARLDQLIPALFKVLDRYGFSGFRLTNWRAIQEWPKKLSDGETVDSPEADFRWVLNAAWIARVGNPALTGVIQAGAQQIWTSITSRIEGAGNPGAKARRVMQGRFGT